MQGRINLGELRILRRGKGWELGREAERCSHEVRFETGMHQNAFAGPAGELLTLPQA